MFHKRYRLYGKASTSISKPLRADRVKRESHSVLVCLKYNISSTPSTPSSSTFLSCSFLIFSYPSVIGNSINTALTGLCTHDRQSESSPNTSAKDTPEGGEVSSPSDFDQVLKDAGLLFEGIVKGGFSDLRGERRKKEHTIRVVTNVVLPLSY